MCCCVLILVGVLGFVMLFCWWESGGFWVWVYGAYAGFWETARV